MHHPDQLLHQYEAAFSQRQFNQSPASLYKPVEHIMQMKGKKIRPLLVLLSCEMFSGDYKKALHPAFAVEVFHNFTLVHDDIMDKAHLRRGQPTVHKLYGTNTAILAGDVMLPYAYSHLTKTDAQYIPALIDIFNKTAIEICEGQQMDVDFETRDDVSIDEYLKMVEYKTSVLLACSMQIGAIVAGANLLQQQAAYQFGLHLGLSFQIKDDVLDAFGEGEKVGKKIGGDILMNKKTYLLISAMQLCNTQQRSALQLLLNESDEQKKIQGIQHLMQTTGALQATNHKADELFKMAVEALNSIALPDPNKQLMLALAHKINNREY